MKRGFLFISILPLVLLTWISNADAIRYRIIYTAPFYTASIEAAHETVRTEIILSNLSPTIPLAVENIEIIDAHTGLTYIGFNPDNCFFVGNLPFTLAPLGAGHSQERFFNSECVDLPKGLTTGQFPGTFARAGLLVIMTVDGPSEREIQATSILITHDLNVLGETRGKASIPARFQRIK